MTICSQCGKPVVLTHAQSASRLKRPHYCSDPCMYLAWGRKAKERFEARFWHRVDKRAEHECWPWLGRIDPRGYGRLDTGGKPHLAHRISYELSIGAIPNLMLVCHSCDNPPCCNPSHLWLGSPSDNMADMARKGRGSTNQGRHGDSHPSSVITSSDAIAIYCSNENVKVLAERYRITPQAIYLIKKGKNWRHVTHAQGILHTNESLGLSKSKREMRNLRHQVDDRQT